MTYRIDDIEVPDNNPFENDQLKREPIVEFLSNFIGRLDGTFVIALDSAFGTGKSTLARMLIGILKGSGHRCIYFDAWKVDYATDPLAALVASIDRIELGSSDPKEKSKYQEQIEEVKCLTNALVKISTANAVKMFTSGIIDPDKILSAARSSGSEPDRIGDVVAEHNRESELVDKFRDELSKVVELLQDDAAAQQPKDTTTPGLVFFVDELDRCRPTFAVQLLERIKHLFDIPGIVFVLSLDKKQVEACIKAVYGAEIDAAEYLRRFFDLEYRIPVPDIKKYVGSLVTRFGLDPIFNKRTQYDRKHFVEYFSILANATGLSLRAIERCMTRLSIVMDQTSSDHYLDPVLLALLIVLRSKNPEYYEEIVNGQATPGDVVQYLTSLSGSKLPQENINILHAYLLAAHPDKEHTRERIADLKTRQSDDRDAASLLQIINSIHRNGRYYISFVDIAKKIDLVSWVS